MEQQKQRRSNKVRRENSTQAIEKAATRLFVERGYRSTSIDLIASKVGMTKGTVYFYFKDKETLLLSLLSKSEEHFFSQIFEAMDGVGNAPEKQIDIFLDRMVRAGVKVDKFLLLLPVLMSTEFKGKQDQVEYRVSEIYDHVYQRLSKIIASGQRAGAFSNHQNSKALAAMIVALTDGLLLEIYRSTSGLTGKVIGQTARNTVRALLQYDVTSISE